MTKKLEVDRANVHLDREGFASRRWFVRLPHGMTNQDVADPAIWRAVQQDRAKAFRRHDQVYVVGHDEDFAATAIVTEATRDAVTLGGLKFIPFPERTTPLFSDETFAIRWNGVGYIVERKQDGAKMGPVHGSEALAVRHIKTLYPSPAA